MISVILCTYAGDDPLEFYRSFSSIVNQTRQPDELVIVIDGPIPGTLNNKITDCVEAAPFNIVIKQLDVNQGHGGALRAGVKSASGTYIAIQDADDISVPTRLEQQFNYIESHEIDLVGGQIEEFTESPDSPERTRWMPVDHESIVALFPKRCPINQTTVLARRKAILESGNYRNVNRMEDYDLWGRMLADGYKFHNLDVVLSKVKVENMSARRGGLEYAQEEIRQQIDFMNYGVVSLPRMMLNIGLRVPFRLLPNKARAWVYSNYFRNDN